MPPKKTLIEGKVTHVSDGDTLKVNFNGLAITVRLDSIDAPEKAQPYGQEAREALSALVLHKDVKIEQVSQDAYGRIVGKVFRGRTYVNEEMVKNGYAWFYAQYATEESFKKLEEKAQRAKLGLWALPRAKRVPPWEWRKNQKAKAETSKALNVKPSRIWVWAGWVVLVGFVLSLGVGIFWFFK